MPWQAGPETLLGTCLQHSQLAHMAAAGDRFLPCFTPDLDDKNQEPGKSDSHASFHTATHGPLCFPLPVTIILEVASVKKAWTQVIFKLWIQ